jgi:hypothetical protein
MKVLRSSPLLFSPDSLALIKEGAMRASTQRPVDEGTANPALFVYSISNQLNGDPS